MTEDQEMLLALERSKDEVSGSSTKQMAAIDVDHDLQQAILASNGAAVASIDSSTKPFNNDLEEAIKRSIQEATNSSSIRSRTELKPIDLDATMNHDSTKKQTPKRQKN